MKSKFRKNQKVYYVDQNGIFEGKIYCVCNFGRDFDSNIDDFYYDINCNGCYFDNIPKEFIFKTEREAVLFFKEEYFNSIKKQYESGLHILKQYWKKSYNK